MIEAHTLSLQTLHNLSDSHLIYAEGRETILGGCCIQAGMTPRSCEPSIYSPTWAKGQSHGQLRGGSGVGLDYFSPNGTLIARN
jgi:hypothetical protein